MPRVRWEEQLCVSCEFVTKFAVYGFFAEHRTGWMEMLWVVVRQIVVHHIKRISFSLAEVLRFGIAC